MHEFDCKDDIGQLDVFVISVSFRRTYSDRVECIVEIITTVDGRSHDSFREVGSGHSPDLRTFRDSGTAENMHTLNRLRPARLGNI